MPAAPPAGRSIAPPCSRPTPTAAAPPSSARGSRPRAAGSSSSPISRKASRCARPCPSTRSTCSNGLLADTDADFVEHDLTPVLNHLGQLNAWRAAAQRFNRPLDAIIHIDTGMHRLGFGAEEAQVLINERGRLRGLQARAADEPSRGLRGAQQRHQRRAALALPQLRARHAGRADLARQLLGHLPRARLPFRPAAAGCRALRHQSAARPRQSDAAGGDFAGAHPADPAN